MKEKAVAMERREAGDLSQKEWKTYDSAVASITDLAGKTDALEEVAAGQRISHMEGMQALESQWEEERALALVAPPQPWHKMQGQQRQQPHLPQQ